jgi:hypothetical protein
MKKEDFLTVCQNCNEIEIGKFGAFQMWIDRGTNSKAYDYYIDKYKKSLSHGICRPCYNAEIDVLMRGRNQNEY